MCPPLNLMRNLEIIAAEAASKTAYKGALKGRTDPMIKPEIKAENGKVIFFFRNNFFIKVSSTVVEITETKRFTGN